MSRELGRQIVSYGVVGVIGTATDVGLFWAMIRAGVWPAVAVSAAFISATALQFLLNRHVSFRAYDRPAFGQARTYVVVTAANWLVALLFVEGGLRIFHLDPLLAKAISIPPTAAIGFIGNRCLTFGPGIRATYRRLRGKA